MSDVVQTQDTAVDDSRAVELTSERLQAFGSTLAKTRDSWIRARAATGWDRRVEQAIDRYHSKDAATKQAAAMMDSVREGFPVTVQKHQPTRSTLFVGITRQKTNANEARLCDILLPTDDRNWGIQPTPDPECAIALKDKGVLIDPATGQPVLIDPKTGGVTTDTQVGQPITKSQVAQASQQAAKDAATAMQRTIDDQLVECDYNAEVRKMIHDAAVQGTGVLKGPMVVMRTRKAWREREETDASGQAQKIRVLEVIEDLKPASFRVDPRMVWEDPACGDDIQNGSGVFELDKKVEKRVRDLLKQPGYLKDQLLQVLEQGPNKTSLFAELQFKSPEGGGSSKEEDNVFLHWIYWGELKPEDLQAAGVEIPAAPDGEVYESISGCVEMINNTVVRAFLNPLEGGDLPYDFYPWEKVQGSVRGYGVPDIMHAQQNATNSAWRMMMDNAGITARGMVIVDRTAVVPADGEMAVQAGKFWYRVDQGVKPSEAFYVVEQESHQQELANIIELAEKIVDQETATPMMAQGQRGSAPETVGGMQLLMNSANVVLRRLVKQYDDYVTKRHIRRYYDYNMAYSDDDAIKGDFQVDARGSGALMLRDIQNQGYLELLQAGASGAYAPMVDRKKLFEKALQGKHIDPRDIMLPDEVIEKNLEAAAQQQPDPRVQAAQITAQGRLQEAQAVAQGREAEIKYRSEAEVQDRALRMEELRLQYEIEVLKTSAAQQISIQEVKARLAEAAITDRTKKELAASEMLLKTNPDNPSHTGI